MQLDSSVHGSTIGQTPRITLLRGGSNVCRGHYAREGP